MQKNGIFTVAFIDKNSHLGREYEQRKEHLFYSGAHFCSPERIIKRLKGAGLAVTETHQTLFPDVELPFECETGYGRGAFVVINSKQS